MKYLERNEVGVGIGMEGSSRGGVHLVDDIA